MKKLLLSAVVATTCAVPARAEMQSGLKQYFEHTGVRYEVLDFNEKTLAVDRQTEGAEDFVMIPETVSVSGSFILDGQRLELTNEQFTVKQINANAFAGNESLYYVTFPSTLTDIGARAFSGCTILDIDSLPSGLETIGDEAFSRCDAISRLTIPASVSEIGAGAFADMTSLQRVVMLESQVSEIKERTFQNCKELEQVFLPLGLRSIGDYAFDTTWSLSDITFPEGLEHIGSHAFAGVDQPSAGYDGGLLSIVFPSSLKSLGENAFHMAPVVTVDMQKASGLEDIPANAFYLCRNMKELKLPGNLKSIDSYAFYGIARNSGRRMSAIEIPSSVTHLSADAFNEARIISLKTGDDISDLPKGSLGEPLMLELGAGVKNIDVNAFTTTDLRLIRIHAATPPSISAEMNLTDLQKQNITVVVDNGCKALYQRHPRWRDFNVVEEGESTVSVHLAGNTPLASEIYLASGLMPSRITSLTVTGNLAAEDFTIIHENMFSLTKLDISGTTNTEIPADAFKDLTLLSEMKLPAGLVKIGDNAFQNCHSMRLTELPGGIETIGNQAFENCSAITVSELPAALRTIGSWGFSNCSAIKAITAGENLEDFGHAGFSSCDLLEHVDLSRSKIKELKANALYICNLKTLLLPPTIEKIGYRSIAINPIRTIEIPGSVTAIDYEAFFNTGLRAVSFGEGITAIERNTMERCPRLVSVSFPSTLKSVAANILTDSPRVSAISCRAIDAPTAASGAFNGILTQKCTLTVPSAAFHNYLNAPQWGMFGNLKCSVDVSVADELDTTMLPEEEYEEIQEEERLEELMEETQPETDAPRRAARRAAREALTSGRHYAKVFNGASVNSAGSGKGNRVFINLKPGQELEAVLFNGRDITADLDDNSLLLPADAQGKLEIKLVNAGIREVSDTGIDADARCDAYTMSGLKIYTGRRADFKAPAGIYLLRTAAGTTEKIVI